MQKQALGLRSRLVLTANDALCHYLYSDARNLHKNDIQFAVEGLPLLIFKYFSRPYLVDIFCRPGSL